MQQIITVNAAQAPAVQGLQPDLFQRFIEYVDASPKTIQTYTRALRQFVKWIRNEGINRPQRSDILNYKRHLEGRYTNSTAQIYLESVKLFFSWTAQEGLYPNVAERIKGEKVDRDHKKNYLTAAAVKAVLGGIDQSTEKGIRDYAIMLLMFTGGLRTIEVSRANVEDLGAEGGQPVLYVQGKGYTDRKKFVKLLPKTEAAIRAYLKTRGAVSGKEALFTSTSNSTRGQRMTTRSVSRIAKQAMVNAGYNSDRYTAHSTRHTAVTLALLAGKPLEEVQQFARHANPATTLIYAHHLKEVNNSCAAAIENEIFG